PKAHARPLELVARRTTPAGLYRSRTASEPALHLGPERLAPVPASRVVRLGRWAFGRRWGKRRRRGHGQRRPRLLDVAGQSPLAPVRSAPSRTPTPTTPSPPTPAPPPAPPPPPPPPAPLAP